MAGGLCLDNRQQFLPDRHVAQFCHRGPVHVPFGTVITVTGDAAATENVSPVLLHVTTTII